MEAIFLYTTLGEAGQKPLVTQAGDLGIVRFSFYFSALSLLDAPSFTSLESLALGSFPSEAPPSHCLGSGCHDSQTANCTSHCLTSLSSSLCSSRPFSTCLPSYHLQLQIWSWCSLLRKHNSHCQPHPNCSPVSLPTHFQPHSNIRKFTAF